jgi:hypothetical protein
MPPRIPEIKQIRGSGIGLGACHFCGDCFQSRE